ncbi:MAG: MFS transporter [Treponema sp.]|nr:MFS transporter [Treponema sp.]
MKLNYRRTMLIGLAFLSISAFWQMYDNIIPLILQNNFGIKETVTGIIMAFDNILALVLLPLFGALSDNVSTKIGKRMPFILVGTGVAIVLMLALMGAVHVHNIVAFITILLLLLVAMGLYRSPAVALMPDLTSAPLRSKANAIINLMGSFGAIYTLIMIRVLLAKGNDANYFPVFFAVALFMAITVAILFFTINENNIKAEVAQETDSMQNTALQKNEAAVQRHETNSSPKMSAPVKRSMIFLLLSIFFWFTAYNAVTTAFSRYTMHVWGAEGGEFASYLMVAVVVSIISYIPIGQISSKIGRKKTILMGIALLGASYFAATFLRTNNPVIFVLLACVGFAWAAINVNSYPMVVEMSAASNIGKFTGLYYTFSMSAQIVTPILSGFLLEHVSYVTLFPYATAFSCLAFITMTFVKHGDNKPEAKTALEALGDAGDD